MVGYLRSVGECDMQDHFVKVSNSLCSCHGVFVYTRRGCLVRAKVLNSSIMIIELFRVLYNSESKNLDLVKMVRFSCEQPAKRDGLLVLCTVVRYLIKCLTRPTCHRTEAVGRNFAGLRLRLEC
jgi:hypothetical protein